jgi:membrane protein involved in colicin uptake
MNYFNRLARLPYDNQRNAAYQAAESRRLAEKEAAAKAKADAEAAAARLKAEEEAKARAQAQAKSQNAYQQGVQQGYHQVECKQGENCSVQGGTRRRRKIKRQSKVKVSRRNAWKRKC